MPAHITVATYVAQKEALYIRGEPDGEGKRPKIPIDLTPFVQNGLLRLVEPVGEVEADWQVYLSSQRPIPGRGEVITGAIAISRQWGIVMDDKRARRVIAPSASGLQLLVTLDLVRHWVEVARPSTAEITHLLKRIQRLASFTPAHDDPHHEWWVQFVG
ncbi:MAG: hypothetical protein OT477_22085 [Chloroflexi bacterium]|nr:hypothetical protein [Chloroflexota bacterium]